MKTKVSLNEKEQVLTRQKAQERNDWNRLQGNIDGSMGDKSSVTIDIEGMGGEIAFAKLAGLMPDLDTTSPKDNDIVMPNGTTVNVKAVSHYDPDLKLLKGGRIRPVDVYLLMAGVFPDYEYRGWATSEELIQEKNLHDYGYGPTYRINWRGLHFTELPEINKEGVIPW